MSSEKAFKELPGSYGIPLAGALKDRLDFYWFQGEVDFFKSRMEKYQSSVYRVNFAPGPPGFPDSKGIALLDQKSFSILLDMEKINKTDTLIGAYTPDLDFTGGYRPLAYLDTKEEKHTKLKNVIFDIFRMKSSKFHPAINQAFQETSTKWEGEIAKSGKADAFDGAGNMVIKYLFGTITGRDPTAPGEASLGDDPHSTFQSWTGVQFAGIAYSKLPHITEELLLHSFRLPFFPVKGKYETLIKYFKTYATELLDLAVTKYGLDKDEATHSLFFSLAINVRLGLLRMIPAVVYHLAKLGPEFQARIAEEVRCVVNSPEDISVATLSKMPLLKGFMLETLRMNPSIYFIFGRAREDLVVESHEAKFHVKKGELLGSYIYFVLRDPKVFQDPHTFKPDRFLGPEGEKLLPYLIWSNGHENEAPKATNKQCPGKDYAEFFTMQFIAELFLKYESFEITDDSTLTTTDFDVSFKALKKRV